MRKLLTSLVCATAGLAALGASADSASAHGYRWYRDYAPLYPQVYYGPPVVYVVPPAYAYYPRPVYRACCGYVVGPAGTYYPQPQYYPRQRYVTPYYFGRRAPLLLLSEPHAFPLATSQAGLNHRSASPSYGRRVMSQWRMYLA